MCIICHVTFIALLSMLVHSFHQNHVPCIFILFWHDVSIFFIFKQSWKKYFSEPQKPGCISRVCPGLFKIFRRGFIRNFLFRTLILVDKGLTLAYIKPHYGRVPYCSPHFSTKNSREHKNARSLSLPQTALRLEKILFSLILSSNRLVQHFKFKFFHQFIESLCEFSLSYSCFVQIVHILCSFHEIMLE